MGTQLQAAALPQEAFALTGTYADPDVARAATTTGGGVLDGCNEILSVTRPEVVAAIHRRYLEAGADVVETNTFGATSVVLAEYDIAELDYALGLASARIARQVADEVAAETGRPRFVAGALGPGTRLISLGQATWDDLLTTYTRGFTGLLEGGADVLLLETLQDLLMAKAGVIAARDAMAKTGRVVPIVLQVTMEQTGTMLLGSDMGAALNFAESFPEIVAVGLNCATGPVEMTPHVRLLGQYSTRPLSIQPNAGLPVMERGQALYRLTPAELAEHHTRFIEEHGAALVGGCCGTTPAHIAAVAEAVGGHAHTADCQWRRVRHLFPGFDFRIVNDAQADAFRLVGCSSLYQFQPYTQDNSVLIIGEKTNANGSKAFRDMMAAENWEGLIELARELEGEGSHVLDVCAAYVGRNESRDLTELLSRMNRQVTVPIMIDSTEADVVERALQCLAGKPIVNSINFEDGEARTECVLALCRAYGAAVVGLTIDEDGMAKSAEKKVAIAERILDRTRKAGLPDHDVFIDCLTFTLGSGDEEFRASAMATLDAIRELRARHPRVNTVLGVSNVSFGLRAAIRPMLNSAFLHYAIEAGLTAAIVHASKIRPESRIDPEIWGIASDLVYDRREFAPA